MGNRKNPDRSARERQVASGDDPARWHDEAYPEDYQGQIQRAIGFSGIDHDFFIVGKARWLTEFMRRFGIPPKSSSMLDIGCGIGLLHPYLDGLSNRIVGVDLSEDAISTARTKNFKNEYHRYDGDALPFEASQFDIALAVTVMHHVPIDRWSVFVAEAYRVLKPGGALIVIEHNPLNPLTRLAVNRCEFDADAILLSARTTMKLLRAAGFRDVKSDYIFFTPFKVELVRRVESWLRFVPFGAQYATFGFKGNQ